MRGRTLWPCTAVLSAAIVISGCGKGGERVRTSIQSPVAAERIRAIRVFVQNANMDAIPQIVDRLDDEDPAVRFVAIVGLERLTGRRLGYRYGGADADRAAAVSRWRRFIVVRPTAATVENESVSLQH